MSLFSLLDLVLVVPEQCLVYLCIYIFLLFLIVSSMHLLTALIPSATVRLPQILLTTGQYQTAVQAMKDSENIVDLKTPLIEVLAALQLEAIEARKAKRGFLEACDMYRNSLRSDAVKNPLRRLLMHQALMASGFYGRVVDFHNVGNPTEFVLNHYRFDIRRDTILTEAVHQSVLEHKQTTTESDETLTNLLLMERRLFGQNRLSPVGGKQFLVLGVPTAEIKNEKELDYVLNLIPIKEHGNFKVDYKLDVPGAEERWKIATVACGPEPLPPFDNTPIDTTKVKFDLKILLPEKPKPLWERIKQKMLEYWVMWFAFWCMFFMVDEEILTLIGLIFAKWKQVNMLKEESERTGGKVYVASARLNKHTTI